MDHRTVIASLSAEARSQLTAKSDVAGLVQLGCHGGAILILGTLIAVRVPLWPLLMVPQGVLIVFLFTLLHESVHRTAFRTRWLNDLVARVCGVLIVLPADWFRSFHFAHHRFTQDPENDPELASPKPDTLGRYLIHLTGIPVWISHVRTLGANALGRCRDGFVPPKERAGVRTEAQLMIAGYAALAGLAIYSGSATLLFAWILPAVIGQPFLRLYLLAEHAHCPHVANMFENTRTTRTIWLVRKLAWNMPYHVEHHAFPAVPFHRLPAFHALIEGRIVHLEAGYVSFHRRYMRSLS